MAKSVKAVNNLMNKSAGVGITYNGSILLAKRCKYCHITGDLVKFPDYWAVFTGSLEPDESPRECASRELFEESNIKLDPKKLSFVKSINNETGTLELFFYDSNILLYPKLNEEHTQYGWFKIDTLDSFHELIDKDIVSAIKKWHGICKYIY